MSLVAYGSSDESENEEEVDDQPKVEIIQNKSIQENKNSQINLPILKIEQENDLSVNNINNEINEKLKFNIIPKPKLNKADNSSVKEIDNAPMPNKINYGQIEKPPTQTKGPTRISIPSLADFKDIEEEDKQNSTKRQPSKIMSGLISILPPPKNSSVNIKAHAMMPHVLTKKSSEIKKPIQANATIAQTTKSVDSFSTLRKPSASTIKSFSNYKSDSEDEDNNESLSGTDFFSLSAPTSIPDEILPAKIKDEINAITALPSVNDSKNVNDNIIAETNKTNTLTSNIINLPKEEILLKNKAEVGPKLPIPEQEYNIDSEGNVAFDDKAIEYLCGKRGVKRKNDFSDVDIIEINGEDIKPDEREWMIKALTDEAAQRPVSVGAGPSGQSKKKHQITYLAHQAKAMELELKNQWAQNKASRQQTRSKYGF